MCLLVLAPRLARAEPFQTIDVPAHGGAYMIDVHPDVLTVFHFPAEIQIAYSVQQPPTMVMEKHARSVTVQPLPGAKYASVNVQTAAFSVGLLLRVVDRPEDAAVQVGFRLLDFEREIARRASLEVDRRWRAAEDELDRERAELQRQRAALAKKKAHLQEIVRTAAMQKIAEGLRGRLRLVPTRGVVRHDSVLLRLERIVWIGSDAYVFFSLQNRESTPYRVEQAVLRVGGMERSDAVSFPHAADADTPGVIGIVPPGDTRTGVIALRDAVNWLGQRVGLQIFQARDQDLAPLAPLTTVFFLGE